MAAPASPTCANDRTGDQRAAANTRKRAAQSTATIPEKKARIGLEQLYILRVGEKPFRIGQTTVDAAGPQSLLAELVGLDTTREHFADRDPGLFTTVISFLRTGTLPKNVWSDSALAANLRAEAAFFGLPTLTAELHEQASVVPPQFT